MQNYACESLNRIEVDRKVVHIVQLGGLSSLTKL